MITGSAPTLIHALLLAALLLPSPAQALYREQAEQTDWLLATVGPVSAVAYAPAVSPLPPGTPPPPPVGWSPSSFGAVTAFAGGGPALFVGSTATRAVAGLDVGSGEVVWRQVREGTERRAVVPRCARGLLNPPALITFFSVHPFIPSHTVPRRPAPRPGHHPGVRNPHHPLQRLHLTRLARGGRGESMGKRGCAALVSQRCCCFGRHGRHRPPSLRRVGGGARRHEWNCQVAGPRRRRAHRKRRRGGPDGCGRRRGRTLFCPRLDRDRRVRVLPRFRPPGRRRRHAHRG